MKHVIVIETPRYAEEEDMRVVLSVIQRIFNKEDEITCSYWNQPQAPLSIPNASDDGGSRLADI